MLVKPVRKISQLKWANAVARPGCIPIPKVRGAAKKAGLRYERRFAEQFPAGLHGQWWEFEDRHGVGYCQTDLVVPVWPFFIVFEVKYTLCQEAFQQLRDLYIPVVGKALGSPVCGIVVCKNLTPHPHQCFQTFDEVVARAGAAPSNTVRERDVIQRDLPVLHWIGQPLFPLSGGKEGSKTGFHTHRSTIEIAPPFRPHMSI